MKLKILIALFAILCFSISRANSQNSSSVFDLVETDDQKGSQPSGNIVNSQPPLSQQNPNLILGPPSTFSSNNQASLNNLNDNLTPINQSSLFTQSNSPNNNNNFNNNNNNNNNNNGNNLQAMLEKIKSKVTNPYLKDNLTVENIANFFANFISGNSFVNNLEVKDIAEFRKVEIKDNLKVKGEAAFEKISFNKIKNRALMITDNEIIFDPEATIKLRNNKIAFKVKDVFEVITFMKYIVKICGSKLEKCDFNNLLKNHNANQIMQIVRTFQKKIDETQKKALEFQEKKVKEEKAKKEEEEKKKEKEKEKENNVNNTQNNSSNKDAEGKSKNEKNAPAQKNNNANNSNNSNSNGNNNNSNKNLRGAGANNNHENAHNNNSKSDSNDAKKTADDLITKHFTFKEKDLMDIEKELSHDFMFKQASDSFEDYSKFLENPQIADMMNNYYYSMPSYGLGMNNLMAPSHF